MTGFNSNPYRSRQNKNKRKRNPSKKIELTKQRNKVRSETSKLKIMK